MAGDKNILVYDDFSFEKPCFMGNLYVQVIRGSETYSFEFSEEWLKKTDYSIILDPELFSIRGRQYTNGKSIFGVFADASPDRWGRNLMNRRERILADKENRKPSKLYDSDYLLGVYDETRMGGLRFKLEPEGSFLSEDNDIPVPPWTSLRTLEEASRKFEKDENGLNDKWINQLIKPGSSLGGARPKATVIDENGNLWIAKFPSKHDENDSGAWEKVVYDLAKLCGLDVSEAKLEKFSKDGSTFLVKRFDRNGRRRIHYASAMTLLGKKDGMSAVDGISYLDIAAFIKSNGAKPKSDLIELWKRIVFNMMVSNTDDHLRNHGFILKEKGWALSPLFDVNPVPYGNELSLNINEFDNRIDIELAIEISNLFGISNKEAKSISEEMQETINKNWMVLAEKYCLSRGQIQNMSPAFRDKFR